MSSSLLMRRTLRASLSFGERMGLPLIAISSDGEMSIT